MKKALVFLLALTLVAGAVFALDVKATLNGEVDFVDQDGNSSLAPYGSGYETATFSGKTEDGNAGFTITDADILSGALFDSIRDWTVWYKLADGQVKVNVGKLRDGTFRTLLAYWGTDTFGGTNRVSGEGLFVTYSPMDELTLGVNLPYSTTAAPALNVLKDVDLGFKFATDAVTVKALAQLDFNFAKAQVVNFGVQFSGVENLGFVALYQAEIASASDMTHKFAAGVDYTMDALWVDVEFAGASAATFVWDAYARATYDVSEEVGTYFKAGYGSVVALYAGIGASYALGNDLALEAYAGYDQSQANSFAACVDLCYSLSF